MEPGGTRWSNPGIRTSSPAYGASKADTERAGGARMGGVMGRGKFPRHRPGRTPPIASTGHQAERRACHSACHSTLPLTEG